MKTLLAACAAAVLILVPVAASDTHAAHWSYSGPGAPEHWADLSSDNAACAAGKRQSPVDIVQSAPASLPALAIAWAKGKYTVVNNGHTIQLDAPAGGTLTVAGRVYDLVQFHFHAPSEHTQGGKPAAMEVHFVHRERGGTNLAVLGVFIDAGRPNPTFASIMAAAPRAAGKTSEIVLDPAALLPAAKADIAKFRALYPMNARPVQPLNGRTISVAP